MVVHCFCLTNKLVQTKGWFNMFKILVYGELEGNYALEGVYFIPDNRAKWEGFVECNNVVNN